MKILFLSHTFIGGTFKVGSHHLHEEAIRSGFQSTHLSTPISIFHRILYKIYPRHFPNQGLRFQNAQNSNPDRIVPKIFFPISTPISTLYGAGALKKILDDDFDLVLIDELYFLRFLKYLSSTATIVVRLTDKQKGKRRLKLLWIYRLRLQGIILTNINILENPNIYGLRIKILNNGFDPEFLGPRKPGPRENRIVYVGSLDARIDWNLVKKIALDSGNISIDFFGEGTYPKFLPTNVNVFNRIRYEQLGELLQKYRFAILPFKDNSTNRARSPMKLLEYVASGVQVLCPDGLLEESAYQYPNVISISYWMKQFQLGDGFLPADLNFEKFPALDSYSWARNLCKIIDFTTSVNLGEKQ